jgi:hypothetical protein
MMTPMGRFCRAEVVAMLLAPAWASADPRWIRLDSPGLEVLSTASEIETRRVLEHLERAGEVFAQGNFFKQGRAETGSGDPLHMILFGSRQEFEPYRPNATAGAFYRQSETGDYIVLGGGARDDALPMAVHEYSHWIAQHSRMRLPPWLSEGIAELYSTMKPLGGQVIVGAPIAARLRALATERWTPLATILEADQNSPYYNEKSKAGSLYNEGWALTHMLAMTPAYGPRFASLLAAIQAGASSREALETVYGKPLEAIEKDLGVYIRPGAFKGATVSIRLRNTGSGAGVHAPAEAAPPFDVKLALLAISNRPGKEAEMQRELNN